MRVRAAGKSMTIGSLFSGIGGLELGLEMAGLGPTIWQVEKDAFCRDILARHWPDAERFNDVCTARPSPARIVCGGFPCQDLSHAGKRAGIHAPRSGLWFEMLRIIAETKPRWVVVENVYQAWRSWVPVVRGGLADLGYASVPLRVSAAEVGAWHRRARGFVVANNDDHLLHEQPGRELGACWSRAIESVRSRSPWAAADDGREPLESIWSDTGVSADADGVRQLQPEGTHPDIRRWLGDCLTVERGDAGTIEPTLGGGVHGVPDRVASTRALGNAVVPQCALAVGIFIDQLERIF